MTSRTNANGHGRDTGPAAGISTGNGGASDAEMEQAALAAMAAAAGADPETGEILPPPQTVYGSGVESASAFSMKSFLPRDPEWIRLNVLTRRTGEHMLIGRISGTVSKIERKTNTFADKIIPSIALHGQFMAENAEGHQWSFPLLFLPRSYSEQIAFAFEHGSANSVEIEIDCGVRVTGKTIPYEWTITYYAEGQAVQALRQRMAARRLGEAPAAARGIGQAARPALTHAMTVDAHAPQREHAHTDQAAD